MRPATGAGHPDAVHPMLRTDPSELDGLRRRLLVAMLDVCRNHHPIYRDGIPGPDPDRGGSASPHDLLANLPLTPKRRFLDDPEAFRLEPDPDWPPSERVVHSVMYTTGTRSGLPAPVYNTGSDYYGILTEAMRAAPLIGLSPADRIANVFPLTPFPTGGYVRTMATAAALGATVACTHTGKPDQGYDVHRRLDDAVDLVVRHETTVVWGLASFVARLLGRAVERGARIPQLRLCLITGERATSSVKEAIQSAMSQLDAAETSIGDRYGFTEGATLIPCSDGAGWHNVVPDQIILEAVDPRSGEAKDDGESGHLAVTHLARRGTVLLRYVVGDEVVLERGACPGCGITTERVTAAPRRSGSIVKVRGTMVDLDALVEALDKLPGLSDFQVRLGQSGDVGSEEPITSLRIRVASEASVKDHVASAVVAEVERIAHLRPTIEHVEATELFDPETEIKRARIVRERE